MENLENQYVTYCPSEGKLLSFHSTSTLYLDEENKKERERERETAICYLFVRGK